MRPTFSAIVCLIAIASSGSALGVDGAKPNLKSEIAACRKAGIALSGKDLETQHPATNRNAAVLYKQWSDLKKSKRFSATDYDSLQKLTNFKFKDGAVREGLQVVAANKDVIALIHKVTSLPECNFAKDWSMGPAVLFPELSEMRSMARWLIGECGALARAGKPKEAVHIIGNVFVLDHHARNIKMTLNFIVASAIDSMAMSNLQKLASQFHDRPDVLNAISSLLLQAPKISESDLFQSQIADTMMMAELMRLSEKQQRESLGITADPKVPVQAIAIMQSLVTDVDDITPQDLAIAQQKLGKIKSPSDIKALHIPVVLPVISAQPPRSDAKRYSQWVDDNVAFALQVLRPIILARSKGHAALQAAMYDSALVTMNSVKNDFLKTGGSIKPSITSLASLSVNIIASELRRQRVGYSNASRGLLSATVDLFQYKLAHGSFPSSLPENIGRKCIDPFNGKSVQYRKQKDGFLVYCVGKTGNYAGGEPAKDQYEARYVYP